MENGQNALPESVSEVRVTGLWDQWGIDKRTLYQRLKAMGIKSDRSGNIATITRQQYEAMCYYDDVLKLSTAEITKIRVDYARKAAELPELSTTPPEFGPITDDFNFTPEQQLLIALTKEFVSKLDAQKAAEIEPEPTQKRNIQYLSPEESVKVQQLLNTICDQRLSLTTIEIAQLLKIGRSTVFKIKSKYGFRFEVSGKDGNNNLWRVYRAN